jgi:hypothetical protein
MKVLILHGVNCHYHILCSFIQQFQEYEIDILFPPEVKTNPYPTESFDGWDQICDHMNLKYNLIREVSKKKYDFCVLPTDDDRIGASYYNRYYNGVPVLVINHERGLKRDGLNTVYKRRLWTWGTHDPSSDYYFFGCRYFNIDEKVRLLSPRTSVVIIGMPSEGEENSPQSLERHITNFKDIDFYVIYRQQPRTYNPSYSNITYKIACDTNQMNSVIARSHYVWYYTSDVPKCSSAVHMAYSMLCRCVLHNVSKNQYGIQTPIFGGDDDQFELKPLTRDDVAVVSNERDYLFSQTQKAIRRRLIGDPMIYEGN